MAHHLDGARGHQLLPLNAQDVKRQISPAKAASVLHQVFKAADRGEKDAHVVVQSHPSIRRAYLRWKKAASSPEKNMRSAYKKLTHSWTKLPDDLRTQEGKKAVFDLLMAAKRLVETIDDMRG